MQSPRKLPGPKPILLVIGLAVLVLYALISSGSWLHSNLLHGTVVGSLRSELAGSILGRSAPEDIGAELAQLQSSVGAIQSQLGSITAAMAKGSSEPQPGGVEDSIWREGAPCEYEKHYPPAGREWHVTPNKYLVAGCIIGGFSNRMEALLAAVKVATALQRTLVVAPFKALEESSLGLTGDVDPLSVLDLELAQACAGEGRVMSWEQFSKVNHGLSTLGLCIHFPGGEDRCEPGHQVGRDTLGVTFETKDMNGFEVKDIPSELNFTADVLWAAEAPFLGALWDWQPRMQCSLEWDLFQPSAAIRLAAQRFIAGMLGSDYASFHLRRGDFFDFIELDADPSTFSRAPVFKELRYTVTPLPTLARCLHHAIRGSNFTTLYVASDAPQWELDRLEKLLAGKGVQTVSLPPYEEWGKHRWARGLAQNSQVAAMLDKFLCTTATVFINSRGSIFSEHVFRMRRSWSLDSCHDHEVCTLPGDESAFTFKDTVPTSEANVRFS